MEIEAHSTLNRLREDVKHLQDWISKEPHLPKIYDEQRLLFFLHHNKNNLEKTKKKIDNYYSFRSKYPEVLKNGDPLMKDIAQAREAFTWSLSKSLTKDGGRIVFTRHNADTRIFDITSVQKYGTMVCELIYLEDDKHDYWMNITDCTDMKYGHFIKSIPWLKTGVEIFLTGYSDRFKAFHMINISPGMEIILNGFKSFLPRKFADRFFVHSTKESLLRMVDESVVCSDFGGQGPSLAECDAHTFKLVEKHREWFLEQDNVCSNERLRRKDQNQVDEMKGSFRKLEVD